MDDEQFLEGLHRRDAAAPVLATGFVEAHSDWDVTIYNDQGGNESLPPGRYRVGVVRGFDDYETGGRLIGRLLDAGDLEIARTTGTTGHPPGASEFRPALVYFGSDIFQPEVRGSGLRGKGRTLR